MEDPMFRAALKERWQTLRASALQTSVLLQMVDDIAGDLQDNGAIQRNFNKWGPVDYTQSVNALKTYLEFRTDWMDGEINRF